MSKTRFASVACITLFAAMLSACGGGSGDAPTPSPPTGGTPPEPTIEGVAMPNNVSVVTATNAS